MSEHDLRLQVTLDVASQSQSQSSAFKLTRERITLKPVSFQMCGPVSDKVGPAEASGKLAYVRVATFNKQTTENAKAAFRQLKADGATRSATCFTAVSVACPVFKER